MGTHLAEDTPGRHERRIVAANRHRTQKARQLFREMREGGMLVKVAKGYVIKDMEAE